MSNSFELKLVRNSRHNCNFAKIDFLGQESAENLEMPFSIKLVQSTVRNCALCF